jgi:hypothetical protein
MFQFKQDKKSLKTFKGNKIKSLYKPSDTEINGKIEDMSEYVMEHATQKKPKKRMPKAEDVFVKNI